MTPTLSEVTIISDNPLYPNNKITVKVDNDLNPELTVVIPETSFPYIVEFDNCSAAVGKRYISQRFFDQLSNPTTGLYLTDKGKIFGTLEKSTTIYPYIKLDYLQFVAAVNNERNKSINVRNTNTIELNYYGASIQSFEFISPEFLLKWLDLPVSDSNGEPINTFPLLLNYENKQNPDVIINLVERKQLDFYATEYFVSVEYNKNESTTELSSDNYDSFFNEIGGNSKTERFNSLKNKSKSKSISNILDSMQKIKGSVLAGASLATTAAALKQKLSQAKPTLPKPPKVVFSLPIFSKLKTKINKTKQKPRDRKRLLGKKKPLPIESVTTPTVAMQQLDKKIRSKSLKDQLNKLKSSALDKQKSIAN